MLVGVVFAGLISCGVAVDFYDAIFLLKFLLLCHSCDSRIGDELALFEREFRVARELRFQQGLASVFCLSLSFWQLLVAEGRTALLADGWLRVRL